LVLKKIETAAAAAKKTFAKMRSRQYHTYFLQPLLAIVVDMKRLVEGVPN
jgi:hypothetical protein